MVASGYEDQRPALRGPAVGFCARALVSASERQATSGNAAWTWSAVASLARASAAAIRGVREQVDLARQTGGGLEERFFGGGLEEREFSAGESQPMRQIAGEFVAGERGHVVANDDALRKGLMDGHGEAPA